MKIFKNKFQINKEIPNLSVIFVIILRTAILFFVVFIGLMFQNALAQDPEYKPYQEKEERKPERFSQFDSLALMVDSFFNEFKRKDYNLINKFIPDIAFIKILFDTLEVEYNAQKLAFRQQRYLRTAQVRYGKLHKKLKKKKYSPEKFVLEKVHYSYGMNENQVEYCYITLYCKEKKRSAEIRFLAVLLNGLWFLGDEFYLL